MARRGYVILFIVILIIAGIGGFLGGRALLQRFQRDFALAPTANWTPAPTGASSGADVTPVDTSDGAQQPRPEESPTRRSTATVLVVTAPGVTPLLPAKTATPSGGETPSAELPTFEPLGSATVEPAPTPPSAFAFVLARSIRYSTGDCPGTYMLGLVTDASGNPLPNIRLSLVDEYGNTQSAVTKAGQADAGRYDFPASGPARRFYMSVVDEAGRSLSDRVEILHDVAPQVGMTCRWVDWRRR